MDPVKFAFRVILGQRLPVTSGTLQVTGLEQPVTTMWLPGARRQAWRTMSTSISNRSARMVAR